jgi:hypothetical protein
MAEQTSQTESVAGFGAGSSTEVHPLGNCSVSIEVAQTGVSGK